MNTEKKSFFYDIARFIVDKRNLFFLVFVCACIFSFFSMGWVEVEEDITKYLDRSTETRRGVELMDKEFITYATANMMVANISYERAKKIKAELEDINGVESVDFENSEEHFKNASGLFGINFSEEEDSVLTKSALNEIENKFKDYDLYISTDIGYSKVESLKKDMNVILIIAAIIIILVLLLTSRAYAEVPVLLITFIAAAILNKGTNFLFKRISYISNAVAVVLQLALAIDYAIILCHRYTEEHKKYETREAVIKALSKAIVEISSSSLTTVSGLLALTVMHFKIGQDLALVLIKAILLSLLSVFTLMPGLLILFGKAIDKTVHKNFVPEINLLGKIVLKTKHVVPFIFIVIVGFGFYFSNKCPYYFGENDLSSFNKDRRQIVRDKINSVFDRTNLLALVVPIENYEKEKQLLDVIEKNPEVKKTVGLSNVEAKDDYVLTDKLNSREFAELFDVDYIEAKFLYSMYALDREYYSQIINNIGNYKIALIDILEFLYKELNENKLSLDDKETVDDINDAHEKIKRAKSQLKSKKYSRMLIKSNLPEEGKKTFSFLRDLHKIVGKYYEKNFYIVGNSTSDYDLSKSFSADNMLISVLSALFVVIVLLFTFKSIGLPLLLISVIQASIWINFAFPYLMKSKLFFLGYLIVNAIQMGANIDYAIVISNRYIDLKKKMSCEKAIVMSLNQAFPTILTSGSILAASGLLIGFISTSGTISSLGICLGRGTIISMILVMCVLPQILLLGDLLIEKTKFDMKRPDVIKKGSGFILVNSYVRGKIAGFIDAKIHGLIKGDIDLFVKSKDINKIGDGSRISNKNKDDK